MKMNRKLNDRILEVNWMWIGFFHMMRNDSSGDGDGRNCLLGLGYICLYITEQNLTQKIGRSIFERTFSLLFKSMRPKRERERERERETVK